MSAETFLNGRITLHAGDCLEQIKALADASVDSVVTDPPYALVSITKRFGKVGSAPVVVPEGKSGAYARASAGFMGKAWDVGDRAFAVEFWAEVYRVLKPGGHVLAFGGTRTYHRLACAIEDAGFDIRDQVGWCFGSGFPKSHDPKKGAGASVCRCAACDDSVRGLREGSDRAGGVVETSRDADVLSAVQRRASRPAMGNARAQGVCSTEVDGVSGRAEERSLEGRGNVPPEAGELRLGSLRPVPSAFSEHGAGGRLRDGASLGDGRVGGPSADTGGMRASPGSCTAEQSEVEPGALAGQPQSQAGRTWQDCPRCGKPMVPEGLGSALKPAWEPICVARKPLDGTLAENVLAHGTGALNIAGCRVPHLSEADRATATPGGKVTSSRRAGGAPDVHREGRVDVARPDTSLGRWPANVIHDGSDEVVAAFPETTSGNLQTHHSLKQSENGSMSGKNYARSPRQDMGGDSGSAARFFYQAKPDHRCELCDALIAELSSKTDGTQSGNSALGNAAASLQRESAGIVRPKISCVNAAEPVSSASHQPSDSSVPPDARALLLSKTVQNVSDAASLCASCATAIAHAIVEARLSGRLGSLPSSLSIDASKRTILSRSLASYVAGRESTDIILTTTNLCALFGCVFHAIAENINSERAEAKASSGQDSRRLWYSSKADSDDRIGSKHPTVKPVDLMRYLVRLVTPPGGVVLDPFAGTGTTGEAAYREGFSAILIEREDEYRADIARRMDLVLAGPDQRRHAIIKAKAKPDDLTGTLFGSPLAAAE